MIVSAVTTGCARGGWMIALNFQFLFWRLCQRAYPPSSAAGRSQGGRRKEQPLWCAAPAVGTVADCASCCRALPRRVAGGHGARGARRDEERGGWGALVGERAQRGAGRGRELARLFRGRSGQLVAALGPGWHALQLLLTTAHQLAASSCGGAWRGRSPVLAAWGARGCCRW